MQMALKEAAEPRPLVSLVSSDPCSSTVVSPARGAEVQELVGVHEWAGCSEHTGHSY